MNRTQGQAGFTLIEIMIVVIIVAALAGMVVPRLIGRSETAKTMIAKADLQTLSTALKLFRLDNDRYPSKSEGLGALLNRPAHAKGWNEAYIEDFVDPWGELYRYSYPSTRTGGTEFDVHSVGPDREDGNDDDIGNWD